MLNINEKSKCCPQIKARNTLRTAMFRERERLGAHHVANGTLNILEVSENDMQQEQYENIENSLGICAQFETSSKLLTIMIREDYIKMVQSSKCSQNQW